MKSGENVVVLLRMCGNVFAITRRPTGLRIRLIGSYDPRRRPPNQQAAYALLRQD